MSGVLIAVVALSALAVLFVLVLAIALARSAAYSDRVERRAHVTWLGRKRKTRRAA